MKIENNTPERISYLKDVAQRNYDDYNWYGNSHYKLMMIAAQVELIRYGVKFLPTYNCYV